MFFLKHGVGKITYKPSKLGQTDAVFGFLSQFISLDVQQLRSVTPGLTHRQIAIDCLYTRLSYYRDRIAGWVSSGQK